MHYNLIKSRNRAYLEELKDRGHEMPIVYDAVNIIQHTEWVINKPVFDVLNHCLENDLPLVVKYNVASLGEIKLCLAQLPSS